MTVNSSPDRYSFQTNRYREKLEKDPTDKEALMMIEQYNDAKAQDEQKILSEEWKKDNLEYDLRSTPWICAKAKAKRQYAQNLYAALCNRDFMKLDVIPILKDQLWHCRCRTEF